MFKNLEAEIARNDIPKEELAHTINKSYQTITLKLNGKYPFTLDEAFKIRNTHFPDLDIDYLFARDIT